MSKNIILTESDISGIVKECIEIIMESNLGEKNDDLIEYCRLRPCDTGLNVEIFLDDSEAYKRNSHPLWVYMQNDYNDISNVIPIDVMYSNQIVLSPSNIGISLTDYQQVLRYINLNRDLIIKLTDETIDHLEYEERQIPIRSGRTDSKQESLVEMAKLSTKKSGLPTVLWLDEGVPTQHGPRIKFKASDDQHVSTEFSSISISTNPIIYNKPPKSKLSNKDLEKIKQFVIANVDLLLSLSSGKLKFSDFLRKMKRV